MPVMSGYGPIVSSGLTTQAEPLTVTVVPPVDVVDEFVEDGEVGDEPPQAAATAATPADPRTSSALRLVNLPWLNCCFACVETIKQPSLRSPVKILLQH